MMVSTFARSAEAACRCIPATPVGALPARRRRLDEQCGMRCSAPGNQKCTESFICCCEKARLKRCNARHCCPQTMLLSPPSFSCPDKSGSKCALLPHSIVFLLPACSHRMPTIFCCLHRHHFKRRRPPPRAQEPQDQRPVEDSEASLRDQGRQRAQHRGAHLAGHRSHQPAPVRALLYLSLLLVQLLVQLLI